MMRVCLATLMALFVSGCNLRPLRETPQPTLPPVITATPMPRPTVAPPPTVVPATVPATAAPVAAAPPSDTPVPPSATASHTPSPAFCEYEVRAQDTLMAIIRVCGYGYQREIAQEVVRINDNVFDEDILPEGEIIRIPRPTPTPPPASPQATVESLASPGFDREAGADSDGGVGCHTVFANDTMVSIAEQYSTTLEILSDMNSQLDWSGCNFTLLAGGEDCVPLLRLGDCVNVPQPTPLPTRFPTPTGSETPTPTATKLAPRLLYPADGATIDSRGLVLQWVGVSGLAAGEVYLVELADQTNNREHRQWTSANSYRAPAEYQPAAGELLQLLWRVSVARQNEAGVYFFVGEQGVWRRFQWQG